MYLGDTIIRQKNLGIYTWVFLCPKMNFQNQAIKGHLMGLSKEKHPF